MDLIPCVGCRRHVLATADHCPFCGTPRSGGLSRIRIAGGRLSRAAVFAGVAACSPHPAPQVRPPPPPAQDAGASTTFATPPPGLDASSKLGAIHGFVIEAATNAPLPDTNVWLQDADGNVRQARADKAGRFAFGDLDVGDYVVGTNGTSGNPHVPTSRQPVRISGSEAIEVTLAVQPPVFDPVINAKPYGAPPARRRVV